MGAGSSGGVWAENAMRLSKLSRAVVAISSTVPSTPKARGCDPGSQGRALDLSRVSSASEHGQLVSSLNRLASGVAGGLHGLDLRGVIAKLLDVVAVEGGAVRQPLSSEVR